MALFGNAREAIIFSDVDRTPTAALVANRGFIPLRTGAITAGNTFKTEHWASPQGDVYDFKIIWPAYYYDMSTFYMKNAPSAFVIKASIEYPAGTFTPILFSGVANGTVSAGFNKASDTVSGLTIPAGARFWVRTCIVSYTSGSTLPLWCPPTSTPINGPGPVLSTDGFGTGDLTASGTISPSVSGNVYGPLMIFGTVKCGNPRSFILFGDSVLHGAGDFATIGPKGGAGFVQRYLDNRYPWISIACPGATAQNVVDNNTTNANPTTITKIGSIVNAGQVRGGFTDCIVNYCINDLKAGRTPANVETDMQTLFTTIKAQAGPPSAANMRIHSLTVGPRTSSTDSWVTTGNQTAAVDGQWPNFATHNASVRAGRAQNSSYIEGSDLYSSSRDSGIWAAHNPGWTSDGTHPNSAGATAIAGSLSV